MPTESKTLTAARVRKENALGKLRELQLRQLEGRLLDAHQVETVWGAELVKSVALQSGFQASIGLGDWRRGGTFW